MKKQSRASLDEALTNMFSSLKYSTNALFYAHVISQMKIIMDEELPAPAGVCFNVDHFELRVNEELFSKYSLEERIFILIHECLHILLGHTQRELPKDFGEDIQIQEKNHLLLNIAQDCAINQLIKTLKVPEQAIMPHNLPVKNTQKVPLLAAYETYYNLLEQELKDQKDKSDDSDDSDKGDSNQPGDSDDSSDSGGSGNSSDLGGSGGSKKSGKGDKLSAALKELTNKIDTHDVWAKSTGDAQLQNEVTEAMINKSVENTQKDKGDIPQNLSDMLSMFNKKAQVNWKKVVKNLTGSKKVGKRLTVMRPSRRFPNRKEIKGVTKDRKFTIVVCVDISGSQSTNEILTGLNEIHSICKLTHTTMKLIQIDAAVHSIEEFSEKTKLFERKGCGGTIMEAGVQYIFKNKIEHDLIIYISDMEIENIREWDKQPKCRTIWLSTTGIIPEWNGWNGHMVLPIKVTK